MITAASSHKELAQAFLEYMVEPQTQKARDRRDALHAGESGDRTASHAG